MTLEELVAEYATAHDVSAATVEQYLYAVRCLDRWRVGALAVGELADDLLNRWATWMLDSGLSRATAKNRLGAVATLWRFAADRSFVPAGPRRLKRIKLPPPLPEAWNDAQMTVLLVVCEAVPGRFKGIRLQRAGLLRAYLLAGWYSGLRMCDLLLLRREQIGSDGAIVIRQHKTGWPILCKLPPDAVAAIDATGAANRDRVFPLNRRTIYFWICRLAKDAGLRGMPKWLRRASATDVEGQQQGAATMHLGHRDPRMAERYVDRRHLPFNRPTPRRIG